MKQSHFPIDALHWVNAGDQNYWSWIRGSRVLLSADAAPTTAVVLVHGWRGDASTTWEAFPKALRSSPKAHSTDAFFFQYPTTQNGPSFCSGPFRDFLLDVLRHPSTSIVNPSLPRDAAARDALALYDKVIVVAHSMGAAVARRALLDLDSDGLHDTERAKLTLLFFAPAHKGSTLALLVESGLGMEALPGASLVGKALTKFYGSLHELAEGSKFLGDLASDAANARLARLQAGGSIAYLRAFVYHCEDDRTVERGKFDEDHQFVPVMEKNHRKICKPDDVYRTPFNALKKFL